jgi:hypothetical protein
MHIWRRFSDLHCSCRVVECILGSRFESLISFRWIMFLVSGCLIQRTRRDAARPAGLLLRFEPVPTCYLFELSCSLLNT